MTLDVPSLQDSYAADGDQIPLLVLFDGIDEVGGTERRAWVLRLSGEVLQRGWRAIVTGRPTGFDGLNTGGRDGGRLALPAAEMPESGSKTLLDGERPVSVPLYHVQPFAWPQIRDFIERF